jgi:glycosyltransferase involved in cell wall biosynthesis
MRILEVCPFSAGICGVWSRASEEARLLSEIGHEVRVFSSNKVKGSNEIAKSHDKIGKVNIERFKAVKLGGESFMYFNYFKEAVKYKPDIIIAHNYRHIHTLLALNVARHLNKLGNKCKVVLVTHAPFVEGNITRSFLESLIVGIYDAVVGKSTLKKFDLILPISHWEIPYLTKIGAKKENIFYVPNGIPPTFFTSKKLKESIDLLFLGRISPKKKLDTLIKAVAILNEERETNLKIVGPPEEKYYNYLVDLTSNLKMNKYVKFMPAVNGLNEKIKTLDSARVFVLPSRVEGMPQALIEAMSREKIVIGSNSEAIRDLIKNNVNGYLFEFDDSLDLARVIKKALTGNKKMAHIARKNVESFNWNKVIIRLNNVLNEVYNS